MISEPAEIVAEMKTPTEEQSSTIHDAKDNNRRTVGGDAAKSGGMNCPIIKTSLSMTSLPPDDNHLDGSEVIKARLRVERPYNSLKKKRNSQRDSWRHSWGSGHSHHSHSSCSLYSNATGIGLSSGKDEFWAALQTNYNYIMDTNLMDTCREARCELECETRTVVNTPECYAKMMQPSRVEGTPEDIKNLRRWLREKEDTLAKAPTLFEATRMTTQQLQRLLADHSVLYYDIVSHARVVSACVRASGKETTTASATAACTDSVNNTSDVLKEPKKTSSPNGEHRTSEDNLKGLEHRYHLLYLKAIEVQCLFEGLLGKRNSSSVLSRASSTETDDEPASKVARYSDFEISQKDFCGIFDNFSHHSETISDEIISEEDDTGNRIDQKQKTPRFSPSSSSNRRQRYHYKHHHPYSRYHEPATVDFDADSEGSDFDDVIVVVSKENLRNSGKKDQSFRTSSSPRNEDAEQTVLSETMDSSSIATKKSGPLVSDQTNIKTVKSFNWPNNTKAGGVAIQSAATVAVINQNATSTTVATTVATAKKRQRTVDVSKFNRSNRKSKNCAIFYFKHLDTDNENFGLSSQGSDAIKSGDPSSDDEGWFYSNDCVDGKNQMNDDSDKENSREIANNSNSGENLNVTLTTSTLFSTAATATSNTTSLQTLQTGNVVSMEEFTTAKERADSAAFNGFAIITNEERGDGNHTFRSDFNRVKVEINLKTVTITPNEVTAINSGSGNSSSGNSSGSDCNKTPVKYVPPPPPASEAVANKESIKQLVLDAENLVRDELLKTPTKRHSAIKIATTVKKRETIMSGSNLQKVQEWLEHQPQKEEPTNVSQPTTDCEASGEYTESDSSHARDSDTSEGFTDSVATCMQTGDSNSQCTSTEIIGGSAEPIPTCGSNLSLGCSKVVRRTNKRSTDRPWSVSCLSQLTESDTINPEKMTANQGLATHSISESALHILSSPDHRAHRKGSPQTPVKSSDSKGSLKRRKPRRRKANSKRSDSGSDGLLQKLFEQQSISSNMNIIEDITEALSMIQLPNTTKKEKKSASELESEEDHLLLKPNFKIGPVTNPSFPTANESKLGSLAALANYMHDEKAEDHTGTEDQSSFSEQAWDNYQEKYNSENYSEGFDSDAARRLLEFGDDYRAFLDSQSDCCSSLSAANNFDSLSPPQMDSLNAAESKLPQQPPVSTVDHIRRRRALELEYERRRELKKKNSHDELRNNRSPNGSASSINNGSVKSGDKLMSKSFAEVVRRLDFGSNSPPQNLRKTSESDTNSIRRRKSEDSSTIRRRISRASEKAFKIYSLGTSSSNASSDEEKEIRSLLTQSRNRLENTNALKIRSHLLRPEDYDEIITTCRDNIVRLNSVLRGAPGTVLSPARCNETRELLTSWENLLGWSETTAVARTMQEEMIILRNALNRLGRQTCDLDSEASIQLVIEELKIEKTQLQTYRTNMLRLNASVHSWLTRESLKSSGELQANLNGSMQAANAVVMEESGPNGDETGGATIQIGTAAQSENVFHTQLKDGVSEMYVAWDEADARVSHQLESLTTSLITWRQLEFGLSEFHQVLHQDRGTLEGLEGALVRGQTSPSELAQNVKIVAKLLSEKVESARQQIAVVSADYTDQEGQSAQTAQFHTVITSSNGSLSDSGISDGGATSDGGLSERERRLGVLRRLAKQLENALAPGSEALRSIAARMESAESELKTLQNTCRELIVRTAVSQQETKTIGTTTSYTLTPSSMVVVQKYSPRLKKSPVSKRKNKRRSSSSNGVVISEVRASPNKEVLPKVFVTAPDGGDPGDPSDDPLDLSDDEMGKKRGWAWRVARIAVPVQLALITLLCAACLMEPHCCDTMNSFYMSFTPQLRYIRGPPPV